MIPFKKQPRPTIILTLGCWLLSGILIQASGQGKPTAAAYYAEKITAATMKAHLEVLASDSLEGRETATTGMIRASDYVASVFRNIGLKPISGDSYFQKVPFLMPSGMTTALVVNGITLERGVHYLVTRAPGDFSWSGSEIIFGGYGIKDTVSGWDDFGDADYAGNAILMMEGEPADAQGISLANPGQVAGAWRRNREKKWTEAIDHHAGLIFYVSESFDKANEAYKRGIQMGALMLDDTTASRRTPVVYLSRETAEKIIGKKLAKALKQTQQQKKPVHFTVKIPVSLQASAPRTACRNVVGYVEGGDKKEEVIVISAHLDHLGKHDGAIFYGADDDGSGMAALLNMAAVFAAAKADGQGPRRSIAFIAFTGEERGLLGSEYYTNHPVFPLEKTVTNLNIDMIGRPDTITRPDTGYVYVIGSNKLTPELGRISEATNSSCCALLLDYRYDDPADKLRLYSRSDHYNFAKHNIPVIFYFTGLNADYHRPTDTIDKIEFDRMEPIVKLVFNTAWELANREPTLMPQTGMNER